MRCAPRWPKSARCHPGRGVRVAAAGRSRRPRLTAAMQLAKAQKQQRRARSRRELIEALQRKTAVQRWVESIESPALASSTCTSRRPRARRSSPRCWRGRRLRPARRHRRAHHRRVRLGQSDRPAARRPRAPGRARRLDLQPARDAGLPRGARVLLQRRRRADRDPRPRRCKARLDGLQPGDPAWPEPAYNGDYVADIAADFARRQDGARRRSHVHRVGRH